jgi:hypothetical protein
MTPRLLTVEEAAAEPAACADMVRALFEAGATVAKVRLRQKGRTWEIEATRGEVAAPRRVMRAE